MDAFDRDRLTDGECEVLFDRLFPQGLAGEDILAEIAPEGWERSPLLAVFHPSVEQVHRERARIQRNLERLRPPDDRGLTPAPTLADTRGSWHETPVDRDREVRELIAMCLWDVFSDNNDVCTPDGRVADIGSFRGAAGFLADRMNREAGSHEYGYMDLYMGSVWVNRRADLTPVHAAIFRRLRDQACDWRYVFPRLCAIDLRDDAESGGDRERSELQETLEASYREAIEEARHQPPPATVAAYREVHGQFPQGWPPWE